MPVYRITVEKFLAAQNEYWTNVYHVNANAGEDTTPITNAIVAAERTILCAPAIITKASITLPGAGSGSVLGANVYNQEGTNVAPNPFPLFVTARVDFTVASSRPSRKYLRYVLDEGSAGITGITSGMLSALNTYAAAIVAVAGICDVDGQPLVSGSAKNALAMRQLRRGSKKSSPRPPLARWV